MNQQKHLKTRLKYLSRKWNEFMMPNIVKNKMYWQQLLLPQEEDHDVIVRIAQSENDFIESFRLLHDIYVDQGYQKPNQERLRWLFQHMLPSTTVIIAEKQGVVIGTISLIRDNPSGLPMEKTCDLSTFRTKKGGAPLTEVCNLAVHPEYRRHNKGTTVIFDLLTYAFQYCTEYFGCADGVLRVSDHYKGFYESIMGAQVIPRTKSIEARNPTVSMTFNAHECLNFYRRRFETTPKLQYIDEKLLGQFPERFVFPEREAPRVLDTVFSPEFLNDLVRMFIQSNSLRPEEENALLKYYGTSESGYHETILPFIQSQTVRRLNPSWMDRSIRFEVAKNIRLRSGDSIAFGTILDLSHQGMKLLINQGPLSLGHELQVYLPLGMQEFQLSAKVKWNDQQVYGLEINERSEAYLAFLDWVREDYFNHYLSSLIRPKKVA